MNRRDKGVTREILLVILIKLLALTAIWWCFVRDAKVSVDAESTARHFTPLALPDGHSVKSGETRAQ